MVIVKVAGFDPKGFVYKPSGYLQNEFMNALRSLPDPYQRPMVLDVDTFTENEALIDDILSQAERNGINLGWGSVLFVEMLREDPDGYRSYRIGVKSPGSREPK